MTTITIVGAGMMGTAMCWPAVDRGHKVRLVGTPLDADIIQSIQANRIHPRLMRAVPSEVEAYFVEELPQAMRGTDLVIGGVSSFGVDWFAQTVGPLSAPWPAGALRDQGIGGSAGRQLADSASGTAAQPGGQPGRAGQPECDWRAVHLA